MTLIFEGNGVKLIERSGVLYLRYDAGAHQVEIREEVVSGVEAEKVKSGEPRLINQVLMRIQTELINANIDPYRSNLDSGKHQF